MGVAIVSSETKFSSSHSSFWNALLPMGDSYIRAQNAKPNRFAASIFSAVPADHRGVINECAFLIFQDAVKLSKRPASLTASEVDFFLKQADIYVAKLRSSKSLVFGEISKAGKIDAIHIAENLYSFFLDEFSDILIKPPFPGCGWVNNAEGDVLSGLTLYEVKAGERQFRLTDIRQLLCYCALDFSSKSYGITKVSLLNPRSGAFIREDLDSLCFKISGVGSAEVLGEIVNYISEPLSRYHAD
jgi:hypothetical protein